MPLTFFVAFVASSRFIPVPIPCFGFQRAKYDSGASPVTRLKSLMKWD
jgi:hypothetical protein